jgi:acyl-CoA thioester hydrolase
MKFDGTTFEMEERVRWGDVDASGSVHFTAYVRMLEWAETEFFRALGFPNKRFDELGVRLRRVHVEFDFFKPAWLDDDLLLRISVSSVGVHSVNMELSVGRRSDMAGLVRVTVVSSCVDEKHELVPVPSELGNVFRMHVTPVEVKG